MCYEFDETDKNLKRSGRKGGFNTAFKKYSFFNINI